MCIRDRDFRPDPVADAVLERALTAGLWAQNHRLTQPWRFLVLGPQMQRALAEAGAGAQVQALPASADEATRAKVWAGAVQKLMTKPRIVVITCVLNGDDFQRREDYAAVCCAIQNIQLAAWGGGLGMPWSSGTPNTQAAAKPVNTEVSSTPMVESESAGFQVERTESNDVRRPPSNRIKARATLPLLFASL